MTDLKWAVEYAASVLSDDKLTSKDRHNVAEQLRAALADVAPPQPQQAGPAVDVLRTALGALECAAADGETYFYDSRGDSIGPAIDAVTSALTTPPQQAPAPQPVGLTDEQKHDLATNWFAEDWLIDKAIGMLGDYESLNGIPAPQATQEKTR